VIRTRGAVMRRIGKSVIKGWEAGVNKMPLAPQMNPSRCLSTYRLPDS
jgi:hypothetical protein